MWPWPACLASLSSLLSSLQTRFSSVSKSNTGQPSLVSLESPAKMSKLEHPTCRGKIPVRKWPSQNGTQACPAPHFPPPQPCQAPALLAFHQLPVGGDLDVQGQLGVHELLVVSQLPSHVLLGLLQGGLQLGQLALGVMEGQLPLLLGRLDVLF